MEKLIGKRLREEKSDWPMEVTTPTPPKAREPRPARVDRTGNPRPERRQVPVRTEKPGRDRPKASSDRVTIGRDGQVRSVVGRPVRRINRQKRR